MPVPVRRSDGRRGSAPGYCNARTAVVVAIVMIALLNFWLRNPGNAVLPQNLRPGSVSVPHRDAQAPYHAPLGGEERQPLPTQAAAQQHPDVIGGHDVHGMGGDATIPRAQLPAPAQSTKPPSSPATTTTPPATEPAATTPAAQPSTSSKDDEPASPPSSSEAQSAPVKREMEPLPAAVSLPSGAGRMPSTPLSTDDNFKAALQRVAVDSTVVVCVGNAAFLPMLTNFYVSSIQRWNIPNFLVVGVTTGMCAKLPSEVECFEMPGMNDKGGNYGTRGFARLVNVKTEVIMASVALGFHSLLVDGDIVFLKNPLPLLKKDMNYDLQIQDDDKGGRNSGFMMCKASPWSLAFLARALHIAHQAKDMRQQPAVNKALGEMKSKPLKVKVLPTDEYPCGMMYFEKPVRRMFFDEHPCDKCVLMHNNWIVGHAAKVYRFKEHLQWFVDTDKYYTSTTNKYLQLDLPNSGANLDMEVSSVKKALKIAGMTNRILILPVFHCHSCTVKGAGGVPGGCKGNPGDRNACNYLANLRVESLDKSGLPYREAMFRHHPWVPEAVKANDREKMFFIASSAEEKPAHNRRADVTILTPDDMAAGPTAEELNKWFGDATVVRIHSLYSVAVSADSGLEKKVGSAVGKATYRQYKGM